MQASPPGRPTRMRAWQRAHSRQVDRSGHVRAAAAVGAPIGAHERVLFAGRDVTGAAVVATGWALYHQPQAGPGQAWLRLGWEDVGRVAWAEGSGILTLTALPCSGSSRLVLPLSGHAPLVELARERVASTLLGGTLVWHRDRACAQVIARRRPGTDQVSWILAFSRADDIDDAGVQAQVALAITELQEEIGPAIAERHRRVS